MHTYNNVCVITNEYLTKREEAWVQKVESHNLSYLAVVRRNKKSAIHGRSIEGAGRLRILAS